MRSDPDRSDRRAYLQGTVRYRAVVEDVRALMPRLEGPLSESGLDPDTATRLVEFVVCRPWPDYWVDRAIGWIDDGVWSDAIRDALYPISQDKSFSQATRHRAWRYVKHPNPLDT